MGRNYVDKKGVNVKARNVRYGEEWRGVYIYKVIKMKRENEDTIYLIGSSGFTSFAFRNGGRRGKCGGRIVFLCQACIRYVCRRYGNLIFALCYLCCSTTP